MKEKVIITSSTGDLNCLKSNPYVKQFEIISTDATGELSKTQIEEIKSNDKIDELIMLLPKEQQQRSFFYKYKDAFPDVRFGFVHFLNGESILFTTDYKGEEFICELLKNRVTSK